MSNEVPTETDDPVVRDASDPPRAPLILIAGDDDLVCVDDTCLPADVER